jgi:hypothetical protein
VGPILGSILLFASQSGTALQGAILLSTFSAGLALPFVLISLSVSQASRYINNFFAVLHAYRALIMFIFGLIAGFLFNLALLSIGGALGSIGATLTNFSGSLLSSAPWLMPLATAIVFAIIAHNKKDHFDLIAVMGGIFLIPLGVLLLTDNFNIVIQYGYEVFRFLNYEGLLNFL